MPKAYLIAEVEVHDPDTYAKYRSKTPEAIAKHGGRFLVRGGESDAREGEAPKGRVVVVEFDNMAAAKTFYESADYQPLIPIRQAASNGRLFFVEGTE